MNITITLPEKPTELVDIVAQFGLKLEIEKNNGWFNAQFGGNLNESYSLASKEETIGKGRTPNKAVERLCKLVSGQMLINWHTEKKINFPMLIHKRGSKEIEKIYKQSLKKN